MPQHKWEKDAATGDEVLFVDGKERARIPDPGKIKFDQGKPGGSTIGLDDIKDEFERVLGCKPDT